ncbi:MAG: hypothetical protein P1U70_25530 [Saprospiraceae bacterium]|jgi:hypothetical protein|nr:hypothetical protein [Saprospiraceae bacterium]
MSINAKHKNDFNKRFEFFQLIDPTFLVFSLIAINFLSFIPHTNEEQYLLYANQHFNPEWITGSLMATEFPGTRYLFELLFGWIVDSFGFEKTVFFGRIINFALMSFPIAVLFKQLRFSNLQMILALQIFILFGQNLFGGEWIFGAMEAKTFAYIFIFWGLTKFLKKEYYTAFGLITAATYFHVLIGGWFAISCLLTLLIQKYPFKKTVQLGFLYGLPLLPLLYYLGKNMLGEVPEYIQKVNLDYIYVYFRNKHHIGLFYDFEYFFQNHFIGVLASLIVFLAFLKLEKLTAFVKTTPVLLTIKNLMLAMFAIGFLFVGVSLMDKLFFDLSGGFLLKSYPFRMQGLACLFFVALSIGFLSQKGRLTDSKHKVLMFLVPILLGSALVNVGLNIRDMVNYQSDTAYNEVIEYLKKETPTSSTIMVLPGNNSQMKNRQNDSFALDLMRRTKRDNFVHFKYIPSTPEKMYQWYQRLKIVEKIEKSPVYLNDVKKEFTINYVLTPQSKELNQKVVFENKAYKIFEIEKENQVGKPIPIKLN